MSEKKITPKKVEKIKKYYKGESGKMQEQVDFQKKRFDDLRKSFDEYKRKVASELGEKERLVNRIEHLNNQVDFLKGENERLTLTTEGQSKHIVDLTNKCEILDGLVTKAKEQLKRATTLLFMKVTRTSTLSGDEHTLELPVTEEQLMRYEFGGILIQDCFPQLTGPEREFIKTGITPDEWINMFGERPTAEGDDDDDHEEEFTHDTTEENKQDEEAF